MVNMTCPIGCVLSAEFLPGGIYKYRSQANSCSETSIHLPLFPKT
jgi:hypothetical protein